MAGGTTALGEFRPHASQLRSRRLAAAPQVWPAVAEGFESFSNRCKEERRLDMDQTVIIRIVSGVLFAVVLGILVQRRRTQVK
jgi:hypothetical protein